MALNKAQLKSDLLAIFTDLSQGKTASAAAEERANAIDAFVRTGEVPAGIPVTGTCPTGGVSGSTSGPGSII